MFSQNDPRYPGKRISGLPGSVLHPTLGMIREQSEAATASIYGNICARGENHPNCRIKKDRIHIYNQEKYYIYIYI